MIELRIYHKNENQDGWELDTEDVIYEGEISSNSSVGEKIEAAKKLCSSCSGNVLVRIFDWDEKAGGWKLMSVSIIAVALDGTKGGK
jgi:hypothetical protein